MVLAGCVSSSSVQCEFGVCPEGRVCDEENDVCAFPDQLIVCQGMPDGTPCDIDGEPIGVCKHDICVTARCGDSLVSEPEVCDGDVPLEGTCVDYAYDYGVLGCTASCDAEPSGCHELGWHFRLLPYTTPVQAIWEDGDNLWVGGNLGLFHYDGTTWETDAGGITTWVHAIWGSGGHLFVAAQINGGADGLLAHYNGSSWEMTIVPERMWGIYGISSTNVYAVGDAGTIRHWDGSTWQTMTGPTPARDLRHVFATTSATTGDVVVAVGALNAPPTASVLWKLSQGTWSEVPTAGANEIIMGIWGATPDKLYLAGYKAASDGTPISGILYRYDTNVFTDDTNALPTTAPLYAIDGNSDGSQIFASGDGGTIDIFDGSAWSRMDTPTTVLLQSVHVGATKIYAAYQSEYFLELDGALWVPKLPSTPPAIADASVLPGQPVFFAVGDCNPYRLSARNGWTPEILGTCGGTQACGTSYGSLISIWVGPNSAYAGAPYGFLYKRNFTTLAWDCVPTNPLGGVKWNKVIWGSSDTDVFVGGADKNNLDVGLAHFDGVSWSDWSARVAPYIKSIFGIWGTSASDVYFVGAGGAIVHYDGANFTAMASNTTMTLHAVWGSGAGDVFAVGDAGTIMHYDGSAWTQMIVPNGLTTPTHPTLVSIDGRGPSDVYAVGGRTLLHYNGEHWAPVQRPQGDPTAVVKVFGPSVQIAGDNGFSARLIGNLLP